MHLSEIINQYVLPFGLVFFVLFFDEYLNYKMGKISYDSFINSIAMMVVCLLAFIGIQIAIRI